MNMVDLLAEVADFKGLYLEEHDDHIRIGKEGWFYRISGSNSMSMNEVADLALPVLLAKERYKVPNVYIYVSEN